MNKIKESKEMYFLPFPTFTFRGKKYWKPTTLKQVIYWFRYWIAYIILPKHYREAIGDYNERMLDDLIETRAKKLN